MVDSSKISGELYDQVFENVRQIVIRKMHELGTLIPAQKPGCYTVHIANSVLPRVVHESKEAAFDAKLLPRTRDNAVFFLDLVQKILEGRGMVVAPYITRDSHGAEILNRFGKPPVKKIN
jgi:hypothetical protein